ncbi:MAG: hypothetical protein FJ030_10175 [Chloroflexi bacterium]|nr:hypothetical protein [Chloroflexota bacterium]
MNGTGRAARCSICSQLAAQESAYQKYGWAEGDTHLPGAAYRLVIVKDLKPNSDRKLQLQQCPECGTYYEHKTDYEYLVNGTEDEQHLARLSDEEAGEYLQA